MPVTVHAELRDVSYEQASRVAYEVMHCIFSIHNELGRFFDEAIYRDEVARRMTEVRAEVLIEVKFDDFRKAYFIDLLAENAFLFELKAVDGLLDCHRSQLLNYLLLTGLRRGKLVNLRSESVEHEFVNTTLTRHDRTAFAIRDAGWREPETDIRGVKQLMVEMLRDWGVGLDLHLYEDALTHFLGGPERVLSAVNIVLNGHIVGRHKVRLSGPATAFKITALPNDGLARFEDHATRFLQHTSLTAIHWINLTRENVNFRTIEKQRT